MSSKYWLSISDDLKINLKPEKANQVRKRILQGELRSDDGIFQDITDEACNYAVNFGNHYGRILGRAMHDLDLEHDNQVSFVNVMWVSLEELLGFTILIAVIADADVNLCEAILAEEASNKLQGFDTTDTLKYVPIFHQSNSGSKSRQDHIEQCMEVGARKIVEAFKRIMHCLCLAGTSRSDIINRFGNDYFALYYLLCSTDHRLHAEEERVAYHLRDLFSLCAREFNVEITYDLELQQRLADFRLIDGVTDR